MFILSTHMLSWRTTENYPRIITKYSSLTIPLDRIHRQMLTFILLFMTNSTFANSIDPDQMASEEAI